MCWEFTPTNCEFTLRGVNRVGTRGTHGYGVNSHYLGMCEEDSLGVNGGRGLSQVGRKSRFSRNGGVLQTQ